MKYRKQTPDRDYIFGNNLQDYAERNEGISYAIRSKILLFYGEWWEDVGKGIPMFQSFVGQMGNENLQNSLQLLIADRIRELDEVREVLNISAAIGKREIKIECKVLTIYDEPLQVEVEI